MYNVLTQSQNLVILLCVTLVGFTIHCRYVGDDGVVYSAFSEGVLEIGLERRGEIFEFLDVGEDEAKVRFAEERVRRRAPHQLSDGPRCCLKVVIKIIIKIIIRAK